MINTTLKTIDDCLKGVGVTVKIDTVENFEPHQINIADYEKVVDYSKCGNDELDKLIAPMNIEEFSNLLKHKDAWRRCTRSDAELCMVIEDDAMIMEEGKAALLSLIDVLKKSDPTNWDVCMLGIAKKVDDGVFQDQMLVSVKHAFTVLPEKECYMITPRSAHKLLATIDKITFSARHHLSWVSITDRVKIVHPVFRVTLDGSKLGLFPSSIHHNNMLILNFEYMEMWKAFSSGGGGEGEIDYSAMAKLYNTVKHINSPDVMHLYAVILYRCKRFDEARDMFDEAIVEMGKKKGMLNARSDLIQNAIQFYKGYQTDLAGIRKIPSRYSANVLA
jgi:GR25 family glycosyltransferase involved in LPS biosynthesis